jgi:hypothetical protein
MTDTVISQNDLVDQPLSTEQQINMMRDTLLKRGQSQYVAYRNFLRQLSLEPAALTALLQKLDDTWVWVRVIISDMQFQS